MTGSKLQVDQETGRPATLRLCLDGAGVCLLGVMSTLRYPSSTAETKWGTHERICETTNATTTTEILKNLITKATTDGHERYLKTRKTTGGATEC